MEKSCALWMRICGSKPARQRQRLRPQTLLPDRRASPNRRNELHLQLETDRATTRSKGAE